MDYRFISETELFTGISVEDTESMLGCLQAYTKVYTKNTVIYAAGTTIGAMGLVLSGSVRVEQTDVWGNQNIFSTAGPGQVFAETYACAPGEVLMVDAVAAADCEILFLNAGKVLKTCPSACQFHNRLVENLLAVMASKNLNLTRKISHISKKSIRARLLSYLSFQSLRQGTCCFDIPFNRQQLADYLCVDRSALSNELGKMRDEGLLEFQRNHFCLHTAEEYIS